MNGASAESADGAMELLLAAAAVGMAGGHEQFSALASNLSELMQVGLPMYFTLARPGVLQAGPPEFLEPEV